MNGWKSETRVTNGTAFRHAWAIMVANRSNYIELWRPSCELANIEVTLLEIEGSVSVFYDLTYNVQVRIWRQSHSGKLLSSFALCKTFSICVSLRFLIGIQPYRNRDCTATLRRQKSIEQCLSSVVKSSIPVRNQSITKIYSELMLW